MLKNKFSIFVLFLKISISLLLIYFIYKYFVHIQNPDAVLKTLSSAPIYVFLVMIASASINWLVEAKKWQILVRHLEFISYSRSIKSVLAGVAVSNILPFKIGEYLGRVVYIKPDNRLPAAFNSIFGSTCQLMITICFGIPALGYYLDATYSSLSTWAIIAVFSIVIVFTFIFLWSSKIKKVQNKWLQKVVEDIKQFSRKQIFFTILLSILRYLIFASAYVFLLLQFDVVQSFRYGFGGVATIFFIQSFAPSIIVTDAGMRVLLPLTIFKNPTIETQVLAASTLNYVANVFTPSLFGLFFVIVKKVNSSDVDIE